MTDTALSPADGIAQLTFRVQRMLEQRSAERGMSVPLARMLGILRDRTPLMSELGAQMGLDKASMSGLVTRAQARGLVERRPAAQDRRAVEVHLTPAGRSAIAAGEEDFTADVTALLAHLPASERETLGNMISRLLVADGLARGIDIR